jgi:hypothetical protein
MATSRGQIVVSQLFVAEKLVAAGLLSSVVA